MKWTQTVLRQRKFTLRKMPHSHTVLEESHAPAWSDLTLRPSLHLMAQPHYNSLFCAFFLLLFESVYYLEGKQNSLLQCLQEVGLGQAEDRSQENPGEVPRSMAGTLVLPPRVHTGRRLGQRL